MLELVEESIALEGVAVPLQDRVGRQEGAVEGVVVLQRIRSAVARDDDRKTNELFDGRSNGAHQGLQSTAGAATQQRGRCVFDSLRHSRPRLLSLCLTWPEVFIRRTRSSMRFGHRAGKSTLLMIVRASANWPKQIGRTQPHKESHQHTTRHTFAWVQKTRETDERHHGHSHV